MGFLRCSLGLGYFLHGIASVKTSEMADVTRVHEQV